MRDAHRSLDILQQLSRRDACTHTADSYLWAGFYRQVPRTSRPTRQPPQPQPGGCGVPSSSEEGSLVPSRHLRRFLQQVAHNGGAGNAELRRRLFAASVRISEL